MTAAKIFVRSGFPFNYDQEAASEDSGLQCRDKSKALQSQAEDADINVLVKRFKISGQLPESMRLPTFQDFSGIFDFRSAMDAVRNAETAFLSVPAHIRARFGHDPQAFVEFCSNAENLPELRRLGLAPEPVDPDADIKKEVEREERKDKIRAKSNPAPEGGKKGTAS